MPAKTWAQQPQKSQGVENFTLVQTARVVPESTAQVYFYRYPNGLRLLVVPDDRNPTANLRFMLDAGSDREVLGETGLAHFFEHMMFRKTEKSPEGNYDRVLSAVGGTGNAGTSDSFVTYYSSFPAAALDEMLNLESERFLGLSLVEPYFTTEKGAVISERKLRVENDPMARAQESLRGLTEQGTPYQWMTIGAKSDVEHMSRDAVAKFYQTYYTPSNTIIAIGGPFVPKDVALQVQRYFGSWQGTTPAKNPLPKDFFSKNIGKQFVCSAATLSHQYQIIYPQAPVKLTPQDVASQMALNTLMSRDSEGDFTKRLLRQNTAVGFSFYQMMWRDLSKPYVISFQLTPEQSFEKAQQAWKNELDRVSKTAITKSVKMQILWQMQNGNASTALLGSSLTEEALNNYFFTGNFNFSKDTETAVRNLKTQDFQKWLKTQLISAPFYVTGITTNPNIPSCDSFNPSIATATKNSSPLASPTTTPQNVQGDSAGGEAPTSLTSHRPTVFIDPMPLPWQNTIWPGLRLERTPLSAGAVLYSLPDPSATQFALTFSFPRVAFATTTADRVSLIAMAELLKRGGFAGKSPEKLEQELDQYGLTLATGLTSTGDLNITISGLTVQFPKALELVQGVLTTPTFEPRALDLWKQESEQRARQLAEGGSMSSQMAFIGVGVAQMAFGPDHEQAKVLERLSPALRNAVTTKDLQRVYKQVLKKGGLQIFLGGGYDKNIPAKLNDLVQRLPSGLSSVPQWLPGRDLQIKPGPGLHVLVIEKPGLSQANVRLSYFLPEFGEMNDLEKASRLVAEEVFSSSGGVVGNDRFSKAMRADSGISYSAFARINPNAVFPNTDMARFDLLFQADTTRLKEAVTIAQSTYQTFVQQGITAAELSQARTSLMNRLLGSETTIFSKLEDVQKDLDQRLDPRSQPELYTLTLLDQAQSLQNVNQFIQSKMALHNSVGILVIFGDLSDAQQEELEQIEGIQSVQILPFSVISAPLSTPLTKEKK